MKKPFFSILVPVFNQTGKMDDCVASVKAQDFDDYEVIFVDDGSTDGSYEMLQDFAKEDARYRVLRHEENRSLLCVRYTGMKAAEGSYLLFLDSDDALLPGALSTLYEHIQQEPTDIIRFGLLTNPGKIELLPVKSENPFVDFINGKLPPQIIRNCVAASVAKQAVEVITPVYCNNGEDTFMSGTLFSFAKSFSDIDRCLYYYQMYGGMSREKESLNMEKLERVLYSVDHCAENLIAFIDKYQPAYSEACRKTCGMIYRYEMCHFLLNAPDERLLIDFLNRFNADKWCDEFDYGCREVLPEYFKRKLGIYAGDRLKFNAF